jgi:hypothetical protein
MGRSTTKTAYTAYIETEVDVDLDDFEEKDLVEYLEDNGYTIVKGKHDSNFESYNELDKRIWQLYLIYKSDQGAGDAMDKALGSFFAEYYNKVSV